MKDISLVSLTSLLLLQLRGMNICDIINKTKRLVVSAADCEAEGTIPTQKQYLCDERKYISLLCLTHLAIFGAVAPSWSTIKSNNLRSHFSMIFYYI